MLWLTFEISGADCSVSAGIINKGQTCKYAIWAAKYLEVKVKWTSSSSHRGIKNIYNPQKATLANDRPTKCLRRQIPHDGKVLCIQNDCYFSPQWAKEVLPLNLVLNGGDWRQSSTTGPNQISWLCFLRDYTITLSWLIVYLQKMLPAPLNRAMRIVGLVRSCFHSRRLPRQRERVLMAMNSNSLKPLKTELEKQKES